MIGDGPTKRSTNISEATGEPLAAISDADALPTDEEQFSFEYYMDRIPTESTVIDSLRTRTKFR